MRAAIEAWRLGARTVIASKRKVGHSGCSAIAETAHAAPVDPEDSPQRYQADTMLGGCFINDPKLVEVLAGGARFDVEGLAEFGVDMVLAPEPAAGHSRKRAVYCRQRRGTELTAPLRSFLESRTGVVIMDNTFVLDLVVRDEIRGALCLSGEEHHFIRARSVVLATGGPGFAYSQTDNTSETTGDGIAMAWRHGAELTDMEMVQFHPTFLVSPQRFVVDPVIFSHGAVLRDAGGTRFMDSFATKEVQPRDVISREIWRHREVYLDVSNVESATLERQSPKIFRLLASGYQGPLQVSPVEHFFMGGVRIDERAETTIPGLFACGEVAGGIHGANRLASSALTECQVFGALAGQNAARYAARAGKGGYPFEKSDLAILETSPIPGKSEEWGPVKEELRAIMWAKVGLIREKEDLQQAAAELYALRERVSTSKPQGVRQAPEPQSLREATELRNLLDVSILIARAALMREESRGAHYRSDFPREDDAWLGNIIIRGEELTFAPAPQTRVHHCKGNQSTGRSTE